MRQLQKKIYYTLEKTGNLFWKKRSFWKRFTIAAVLDKCPNIPSTRNIYARKFIIKSLNMNPFKHIFFSLKLNSYTFFQTLRTLVFSPCILTRNFQSYVKFLVFFPRENLGLDYFFFFFFLYDRVKNCLSAGSHKVSLHLLQIDFLTPDAALKLVVSP